MAGQVAQHRVEAELARRLPTVRELDLQATVGGPPQQLGVDLLDGADASHHQPLDPEGAGVGGVATRRSPWRVVTVASAAIGTVRAANELA